MIGGFVAIGVIGFDFEALAGRPNMPRLRPDQFIGIADGQFA